MSVEDHIARRFRYIEDKFAKSIDRIYRPLISSEIQLIQSWLDRADASPAAHQHLEGIRVRFEQNGFYGMTLVQFRNQVYPEFQQFGLNLEDQRRDDMATLNKISSSGFKP